MKKNITINLCGRLFNIDEDALEIGMVMMVVLALSYKP